MKYLTYTEEGKFDGWYDDLVHKTIPRLNIPITDADYANYDRSLQDGMDLIVEDGQIKAVNKPAPNKNWDDIRSERNLLLAESDYTQMLDAELTDAQKEEWFYYRRALRRITETYDDPNDVEWPLPPA